MFQKKDRLEQPRQGPVLRNLARGKEVFIDIVAWRKNGRSIAKVKADGKSVNRAMKNKVKK